MAEIIYYDASNYVMICEVGDHRYESGGQADGYCYVHNDFDCKLTDAEWRQWEEAEMNYFLVGVIA